MQVQAILVVNLNSPEEVNNWLQGQQNISIHFVALENNVFYIFYE